MKITHIMSCIVWESLPVIFTNATKTKQQNPHKPAHTQNIYSPSSLRLVQNLSIVSEFSKRCSCCNNKWKTTFHTSECISACVGDEPVQYHWKISTMKARSVNHSRGHSVCQRLSGWTHPWHVSWRQAQGPIWHQLPDMMFFNCSLEKWWTTALQNIFYSCLEPCKHAELQSPAKTKSWFGPEPK